MPARAYRVVLIKRSQYDHDGYVIQWLRSTLPSNSLAGAYGLIEQCARDRVLGPDVDIEIEACDECNTIVDAKASVRRVHAAGGGVVGLVGVQSNQYPRALDLGRQFRALGVPVIHRRLSCQRLHLHAADTARRSPASARSRHSSVRGRGRRPLKRISDKCPLSGNEAGIT